MRINAIELKNFKRFTHVMISGIPSTAKLILLIGANGSGKSSLFDAFSWIAQGVTKSKPYNTEDTLYYYRKNIHQPESVKIEFNNNQGIYKVGDLLSKGEKLVNRFIGRSSNRIVPHITKGGNIRLVAKDLDNPKAFIENDIRFETDVYLFYNK